MLVLWRKDSVCVRLTPVLPLRAMLPCICAPGRQRVISAVAGFIHALQGLAWQSWDDLLQTAGSEVTVVVLGEFV